MNVFLIILGIIFIVAGIAYTLIKHIRYTYDELEETTKPNKFITIGLILLGIIAIVFSSSFTIVPTGYTGVKSQFGIIKETPISQGFNWITPFIEDVELVNNKQQDITYNDRVWSESSEQTVVYMENITITYSINPQKSAWIVANVNDYTHNLISDDLISSALKTASRSIVTVDVTSRGIIEPEAKIRLQEALDEKYGENTISIIAVVINNIDFEDSYNYALAQRQEAIVNQEYQAIVNQTNIDQAKAEADVEREKAQGEADAALIRAEAAAEAELIEANAKAEANNIIAESITDKTQRQDAIDAWNGELPQYVGNGSDLSFGIFDIIGSEVKSEPEYARNTVPDEE